MSGSTLLVLVYLPVVGALIGYTTKSVAVWLIFNPPRFVGLGPVGWQGIVQRRSPKFAAGVADTVTETALNLDDLLGRIDPVEMAELLRPALESAAPELASACLDVARAAGGVEPDQASRSRLEHALPGLGVDLVAGTVKDVLPEAAATIDVRGMVIDLLSGENADRLANLTKTVAARELRFVIWYGALLGFVIGALEVGAFEALNRWWLLPIVGALDGLVNNWLAIQMIFRPLERTRYLGVLPYQGLFPARQADISRDYGVMLAAEVLTPANLLDQVAASPPIMVAALATVDGRLDSLEQVVREVTELGDDVAIRQQLLFGLLPVLTALAPQLRPQLEASLAERLAIASTIEENLAAMPKVQFEKVLRGIFEEDEVTLIIIGGVLGTLIGLVQAGALLGFGLG